MYRVSDEQIEFILDDIKKRGIEMEDLQLNLLDHICCILERELKETDDFNAKYNKTIKQFFKSELWEIEEETVGLLYFKNYYKMKRFLYILLVLSLSYNAIVLARLGYEFYQTKKYQNEWKPIEKVSFEEGLEDFKLKMKQQYPEIISKEYTYITFNFDLYPYINYGEMNMEDSLIYNMQIKTETISLKRHDSLAAIYRSINFVYAYRYSDESVDKEILKNEALTHNLIYVKDVPKLLVGYGNFKKRTGISFPTTFLINKSGKILYESSVSMSFIDKKLINILNEIK
ncbi:MAG TPA: hypothetical protein PLC65_06720 [Bacteroidia bacterium]|nr:hypothetical protein [Bacteroidia bacterium]